MNLVDQSALRAFLADLVPPFSQLSIKLLAGGASNLTFLVSLDDRRYVMRRRPLGSSAPKAHDMFREYRILNALQGRDLPIPQVYAYHEEPDIVGAPFYLMDFREGIVIHDSSAAEALDPQQAEQASRSLVDTLARLHELEADDLQLENFGRPDGFLGRRINSWLRQWNSVKHRDFPQLERIGQVLQDNIPEQKYSTLVHGDYRLGNVILDLEDGASVKAVLDWEMSTIGDPITDVAHLLVYWEPTRGRNTHPAQLISRRPGFLSGDELVKLYEEKTGRDLGQLPFYLAFEHWRAAIIKDAIYLRRLEGLANDDEEHSDQELQEFGDSIELHLEEASEILAELNLGQDS